MRAEQRTEVRRLSRMRTEIMAEARIERKNKSKTGEEISFGNKNTKDSD